MSWSSTANTCVAATELLAKEDDIHAEVIDLCTLWSWDRKTVFGSIEKAGRVIGAHESTKVGGFEARCLRKLRRTSGAS